MNELNPAVPPPLNDPQQDGRNLPLGTNQQERESITGFAPVIESLLRQPRRVMYQLRQGSQAGLIGKLLALAAICSLIYGLVVGTFSVGDQLWAAPVKISLGLLLAAFICLPSLYIFSALGGSEARLVEVVGLVAGLLALSTILLIGFAPVAWVFSQSTQSVPAMGALHLLFWFIATAFGLRFLYSGFKHLGGRSSTGLNIWILIFLLVSLQMTTALRPIVGSDKTFLPALTQKKFFLSHWADCMNLKDAGHRQLSKTPRSVRIELMSETEQLLRTRIRWLIGFFIFGLVVSGATAIPLAWEVKTIVAFVGGDGSAVAQNGIPAWLWKVHDSLQFVSNTYPFLAYGTDWLAFGHFVIALAFIGAWRDPVRNIWLFDFGLLACALIIPYALVFGAVRGIPFGWRLIDCSFGILGAVPLALARRYARRLQDNARGIASR